MGKKSGLVCSLIGVALHFMLVFSLAQHHGLIGIVTAILILETTATTFTWVLLRKKLPYPDTASGPVPDFD